MNAYTPGLWTFDGDHIVATTGTNTELIADLVSHQAGHADRRPPEAQRQANGRLITAAPNMLGILKAIHARLELEECEHPGGVYLCAAYRRDIGEIIAQIEEPTR